MIRVLRFFSSEVQNVHRAAYILALAAIVSSLLALLRDRLFAHTFGAGIELDMYYAAFRIPDIIFVATTAFVSVYVLLPELTRRDHDAQRSYIDTVFVGFSILSICVSAIAAYVSPFILATLFPNFVEGGYMKDVVLLTRIILLQPIILGFSNIFAAIIQLRRRFVLYALSPILYNIGIIAGVLVLYPTFGLSGLAWGVVLGALLHSLILVPSVLQDGFFSSFSLVRWDELFETARMSIPRSLALAMNQLTFLGLMVIAGTLSVGSIASFMFAYNLYSVPLAIIGASYSVATFPTLALAFSRGAHDEFVLQVATAARHVLFWSFPAVALLIVLRAHIVRAVLGSGAFDWTDTRITAATLALLAVSIVAQGIILLLVRGYYAAGRSFIPLVCYSAIAFLTIAVSYALVYALKTPLLLEVVEHTFRVSGLPGSSIVALAFAYSAISVLGVLLLSIDFEYRFSNFFFHVRRALSEAAFAALVAGTVSYFVLTALGTLTQATTFLVVLTHGFVAGSVGIIGAIGVYYVLGSREFAEIVSAFLERFLDRNSSLPQPHVVASAEE